MKKILMTGVLALTLSLTACDSYLDINVSPNSPSQDNLNPDLIFPGAEMAFANNYGDYLRITGGYFSQHYSQFFGTSNYLESYSKFNTSASLSSGMYTNLTTRVLQNLSTVIAMAKERGEMGTVLACKVIRVAAYQVMVDCYGEIPYSEALDINNITPKFDDGADIYAGLIAELDEAVAACSGMETVCTNFLLPGYRASEWIKLANALKLKLLMRESNVANVQSQLAALVSENNFPSSDVAWKGCWKNEDGQTTPFFREEFFPGMQKNVILNLALSATMIGSDDPRLEAFFLPNDSGNYTGGISGSNFATTASYKAGYWCRPNVNFDTPVYFITRAEIEFFLAEYEARYGSQAAAKEHYEAAIRSSCESAGVAGTGGILEAYPWDSTNWQKCIGIQKWVALSGVNNYEAYCELRRLKYPAFGEVTGEQIYNVVTDDYQPSLLVPGTLYTPIQVNGKLGADKILQRWDYPTASTTRNNKAPEFKGYGVPVFWAD